MAWQVESVVLLRLCTMLDLVQMVEPQAAWCFAVCETRAIVRAAYTV